MKKVRVDIEFCKALREMRAVINHHDFDQIEWYENGKPRKIHPQVLKQFKFTGLNNMDFLLMLEDEDVIKRQVRNAKRRKKTKKCS